MIIKISQTQTRQSLFSFATFLLNIWLLGRVEVGGCGNSSSSGCGAPPAAPPPLLVERRMMRWWEKCESGPVLPAGLPPPVSFAPPSDTRRLHPKPDPQRRAASVPPNPAELFLPPPVSQEMLTPRRSVLCWRPANSPLIQHGFLWKCCLGCGNVFIFMTPPFFSPLCAAPLFWAWLKSQDGTRGSRLSGGGHWGHVQTA